MSWLQSIDVAIFQFINAKLSHPVLDQIVPIFSGFPGFVPLVIAVGVLLLWKGGRRERLFVLVLALTLALGETFVIATIKDAIGRQRPFLDLLDTHLLSGRTGSGSMPSSHTSNWFAITMVTLLYYRRSWRFLLPIACLVGFSRIYVGVHYPSDVLAGAILGAGYGIGFALTLNLFWTRVGRDWFPLWWQELPSLILPEPQLVSTTKDDQPLPVSTDSAPIAQEPSRVSSATLLTTQVKASVTTESEIQTIRDQQWLRLGYLIIAVLFLVQLAYLASRKIELSGDEAYQWVWSKHLALSYYSKPPMIAYLQFVGTSIWGDSELGVRFFAPLIASLISLMALRFFAREVNARAGFWLVLIFNCTPLLGVGGTLMTIDPPLCLFWVAAMIAGWRAIKPDSTARHWLWVGLWTGLGFLSKYSALFQIFCWAVFFILWSPARRQLRRPGPYLALLVVAICTIPVIIWNAQHDWITVHHVAYDNAGLARRWEPTLKFLGEFLGAELGLLNPVFFCGMVWACVAFWRWANHSSAKPLALYFFSMGAPVFIFFMLFSGYKRVLPNWIAPAVVPLFCLMVLHFHFRWQEYSYSRTSIKRWLAAGVILGVFVNIFLHDTNMLNKLAGRSLPVPLDPLRRVRAWSDTAKAVGEAREKLLAEGKPVFIIASHYAMAGECSFYLPTARAAVRDRALIFCPTESTPGNQFYFWPGYRAQRQGENAIFVHELELPKLEKGWFPKWVQGRDDLYKAPPPANLPPPQQLLAEFDSVTSLGGVDVQYRGRIFRRLQLFACRNLR